jgi:hypothetical protein
MHLLSGLQRADNWLALLSSPANILVEKNNSTGFTGFIFNLVNPVNPVKFLFLKEVFHFIAQPARRNHLS